MTVPSQYLSSWQIATSVPSALPVPPAPVIPPVPPIVFIPHAPLTPAPPPVLPVPSPCSFSQPHELSSWSVPATVAAASPVPLPAPVMTPQVAQLTTPSHSSSTARTGSYANSSNSAQALSISAGDNNRLTQYRPTPSAGSDPLKVGSLTITPPRSLAIPPVPIPAPLSPSSLMIGQSPSMHFTSPSSTPQSQSAYIPSVTLVQKSSHGPSTNVGMTYTTTHLPQSVLSVPTNADSAAISSGVPTAAGMTTYAPAPAAISSGVPTAVGMTAYAPAPAPAPAAISSGVPTAAGMTTYAPAPAAISSGVPTAAGMTTYAPAPAAISSGVPTAAGMTTYAPAPAAISSGVPTAVGMTAYAPAPAAISSGVPTAAGMTTYAPAPAAISSGVPTAAGMTTYAPAPAAISSGVPTAAGMTTYAPAPAAISSGVPTAAGMTTYAPAPAPAPAAISSGVPTAVGMTAYAPAPAPAPAAISSGVPTAVGMTTYAPAPAPAAISSGVPTASDSSVSKVLPVPDSVVNVSMNAQLSDIAPAEPATLPPVPLPEPDYSDLVSPPLLQCVSATITRVSALGQIIACTILRAPVKCAVAESIFDGMPQPLPPECVMFGGAAYLTTQLQPRTTGARPKSSSSDYARTSHGDKSTSTSSHHRLRERRMVAADARRNKLRAQQRHIVETERLRFMSDQLAVAQQFLGIASCNARSSQQTAATTSSSAVARDVSPGRHEGDVSADGVADNRCSRDYNTGQSTAHSRSGANADTFSVSHSMSALGGNYANDRSASMDATANTVTVSDASAMADYDVADADWRKANLCTLAFWASAQQLDEALGKPGIHACIDHMGYVSYRHRAWGLKRRGTGYTIGFGGRATPLQYAAVACKTDNVIVLLLRGARDEQRPLLKDIMPCESYRMVAKLLQQKTGKPSIRRPARSSRSNHAQHSRVEAEADSHTDTHAIVYAATTPLGTSTTGCNNTVE